MAPGLRRELASYCVSVRDAEETAEYSPHSDSGYVYACKTHRHYVVALTRADAIRQARIMAGWGDDVRQSGLVEIRKMSLLTGGDR